MAEDRTSEFLSLARGLPDVNTNGRTGPSSSLNGRYGRSANPTGSTATSAPNQQHYQNNPAYSQLKDFHTNAGGISRDIAATSALLGELAQLVRQKSLFVDDSQRVNGLVVQIKQSIENLNGRLDEAGRTIQQQKRQLGKNSQAGQEATNLVGQLQEEFVEATAGFKKVLQQRTDVMKETTDRKRQVYGGADDSPSRGKKNNDPSSMLSLENKPPVYEPYGTSIGSSGVSMGQSGFPTLDLTSGMAAGEPTSSGSQLPRPHGAMDSGIRMRRGGSMEENPIPDMSMYSGSSNYYGSGQQSTPLTPYDIQRMEQESGQSQMMQLIPDQDYLRERADAMEQVESSIVELGTIYNKLAGMVSEHRDMVQRVEDNVDDANSSINLSLATLTDTLTNLQSNRSLFFKIMGILTLFIISFIIFFA